MLRKLTFIFVAFLFLFSVKNVFADTEFLVINEFTSQGDDDWVEVYLKPEATSSAQLSAYRIRDNTESNKIDLNGEQAPGSHKAFDFGNKLNNSGDNITLRKITGDSEVVIDQISYGDKGNICTPESSQSIGRKPDGSGSFTRLSTSTKGSVNSIEESICPTPTPSPSPSLSPSPTVSPTSTPTPTVTAKPTATPKPTVKPTSISKPSLGPVETPESTPFFVGEPTSTPEVLGETSNVENDGFNLPLPALGLIGGGILSMGIAGASILKSKYKTSHES